MEAKEMSTLADYDRLLEEIKDNANREARKNIRALYNFLIEKNWDELTAADKVREDLADIYSYDTLKYYLPQSSIRKYKNKKPVESAMEYQGNPDISTKKPIEVSTDGSQEPAKAEIQDNTRQPSDAMRDINTLAHIQGQGEQEQQPPDILTVHIKPSPKLRLAMNRLWQNESYSDVDIDINTQSVIDVRDGGKK